MGDDGEEQASVGDLCSGTAGSAASGTHELRSLGMCEGSLPPPLGLQPQLYLHLCWLAGVALAALFSVGLILNDFEPNRKGRSLAAVAWLKQSGSQGHGFGICR